MRYFLVVSMVATIGAACPPPELARADKKPKLWAAITINEPVFEVGKLNDRLMLIFSVVNDDQKNIDPEIEDSKLLVNGKQPENWENTIGQGIRDDRFHALPSGDYLLFTYAMGETFAKPGIYKVTWKGKNFETPEITFRVIPSRQK